MPDNLKVISADRWRPVNRGGDFSAIVVCPECGRDASLGSHTIDSKGIVWPRVRCPWNRKLHPELTDRMNRDKAQDCTFHAGVRLDNWPPVDLGQVLGMPSGAQVPLATPPNQDYTA